MGNDFEASSSTSGQISYRASMLRSAANRRSIDRRRGMNMVDDGAVIGIDRGSVGGNVADDNYVDMDIMSSPEYMDLGSCNEVCEFCGALFWFEERVKSVRRGLRLRYNGCCKGGRAILQYPVSPPDLLRNLMGSVNFLSNIRAYNSMFSMTSFGATVDESINEGSGPYVFKVSGQVCHWVGSLCPVDSERPRFLQMYMYDCENEIANRV